MKHKYYMFSNVKIFTNGFYNYGALYTIKNAGFPFVLCSGYKTARAAEKAAKRIINRLNVA